MGHLNGTLARVGGNLNNNFQKSQMAGGVPGGEGLTDTLVSTSHEILSNIDRNLTGTQLRLPKNRNKINPARVRIPFDNWISGRVDTK